MSTRAQRFSGKTAEEAVLNAIDALGEDAEVVDARRVKRPGFAGMFGGEEVVVTARPRTAAAPKPRATAPAPAKPSRRQAKAAAKAASSRKFRSSLRAAMDDQGPVGPEDHWFVDLADDERWDDADDRNYRDDPRRAQPRVEEAVLDLRDGDGPAAPRESRLPARFSAEDLAPLPPPPPGATARAVRVVDGTPDALFSLAPAPPVPAGIAVAANPAVIDLRSHARQRARATSLTAPPPPPPPQQPLPEAARSVVELVGKGDGAVRWSRAELRAIGVPERVLGYLPANDPISDTVWTHALETAIWWTLRKHRSRTNLVVDGYGPEGAMALLEAVLEGHVIRYLHLGDRSVDATPAELAKAIRSCLPR